jgi:hypothetical protein
LRAKADAGILRGMEHFVGTIQECEKQIAKAAVAALYAKTPSGLLVLKARKARKPRKTGRRCKVLQFPDRAGQRASLSANGAVIAQG